MMAVAVQGAPHTSESGHVSAHVDTRSDRRIRTRTRELLHYEYNAYAYCMHRIMCCAALHNGPRCVYDFANATLPAKQNLNVPDFCF